MPTLYPGGELTYLGLYGELSALGFAHGRDFRRRYSQQMGWHFAVSDDAYHAWMASKGGTPPTAEAPAAEAAAGTTSPPTGDNGETETEAGPAATTASAARRASGKKGRSA